MCVLTEPFLVRGGLCVQKSSQFPTGASPSPPGCLLRLSLRAGVASQSRRRCLYDSARDERCEGGGSGTTNGRDRAGWCTAEAPAAGLVCGTRSAVCDLRSRIVG